MTIVLVVIFVSLSLPRVSNAQDEITICTGFSNPYQRVFVDSSGKARIHAIAPSWAESIEQDFKDTQQRIRKYDQEILSISSGTYEYDPRADLAELYTQVDELYERLKLRVNVEKGISVTYVRNYLENINGTFCTVDVFWNDDDGCVVYANAKPIQPLHFYSNDEVHALVAKGVISWDASANYGFGGYISRNGEIIYYNANSNRFEGPPPSSLGW